MAVLRTRVTGPVNLPNGAVAPDGGKIIFTMQGFDLQNGEVVLKGSVEAPIVGGAIDVSLFRTSSGARGSVYAVGYTYFNAAARAWVGEHLGYISLTGAGPVTLAALLSIPAPIPNVPDALAQALGAKAAAEAAAAQAKGYADRSAEYLRQVEEIATLPLARGFATRADAAAYAGSLELYDAIQTLGRSAIGDGGGAVYMRKTSAVRGELIDQRGGRWGPTMDTHLHPETFGTVKNDGSVDDGAALQEMLDAIRDYGGGTGVLLPARTYHIGRTIKYNPTVMGLSGMGHSILNWGIKTFVDPAAQTQLVSNPNLDGQSGWTVSAQNNQTLTWGTGGNAGVSWPNPTTEVKYAEFGQRITIGAGVRLSVEVEVEYINTVTVDINTFRDIAVSLRQSGIGVGTSASTLIYLRNTHPSYASRKFTLQWVTPWANPYLTVQSNSGAKVKRVSLRIMAENEGVYVETPAVAPMNHTTHLAMEKFRMIGTGTAAQQKFATGFYFDSATAGRASRAILRNIDANQGWGHAEVMFNRAYLIEHHSCRLIGSETCIKTVMGAADAGENITYYGGNIGGGKIGILNEGAFDLRFFGHSNDFSRQWIVASAGTVECHGCHWENSSFATDQKSTDDHYRVDLSGDAQLMFFGGYILNGGSAENLENARAPMRLRDTSRAYIRGTDHYGLLGDEGVIGLTADRAVLDMRECHNTSGNTAAIIAASENECAPMDGPSVPFAHIRKGGETAGQFVMSNAQSRSGSGSILMKKSALVGSGTAFMESVLFPISPRAQFGLTGYWKVPAQGRGVFDLYLQTFFVQVVNGEILQKLYISDLPQFGVDSNAGTDWTYFRSSSTRLDNTTPHSGHAPAWATHVALDISMFMAPANAEVYFDDFHFNQF